MKTYNDQIRDLEIKIENLRQAEKNAPDFDIFDESEENQANGQITLDIISQRQAAVLELEELRAKAAPDLSPEDIAELSQPIL